MKVERIGWTNGALEALGRYFIVVAAVGLFVRFAPARLAPRI